MVTYRPNLYSNSNSTSPSTYHVNNHNSTNITSLNTTLPIGISIRAKRVSSSEQPNGFALLQSSSSIALNNKANAIELNGASDITANKAGRYKLMMELLKTTYPDYEDIPRTTRKRILRFLCDNGWIDI